MHPPIAFDRLAASSRSGARRRPISASILPPLVATAMAALLAACGGDDAGKATTAGSDTSTGGDVAAEDIVADTAAADTAAADTDATDTDDRAEDTAPAYDCAKGCAGFTACEDAVPAQLCGSLCTEAETAAGAQVCLTTTADCDSYVDCMLALKIPKPAKTRDFDQGPTGIGYRDLAGDFTIPTEKGDWNFQAHFDGNDSYIFVMTGKGWYKGSDGTDYGLKLRDDATSADLKKLLELAPKNTHWFFLGYRDQDGKDNAAAHVAAFKKKFEPALASLSPIDRAYWKQRIHFGTAPAPIANEPISVPKTIGGWLGGFTQKKAPRVFAIDRKQRLRQIGLLGLVGQAKWFIQHLAYEAQYYDFEIARDAQYPTEGVKEVVLLQDEVYKAPFIDVELPPAAEMAGYDTLELDHAQMCKDHDDTNCFEWDYLSGLKLAERPVVADNPYASTACTVAVKEVAAAAEVLGSCEGGDKAGTACKAGADCPGGSCKGYKAEVVAVPGVPGDTKACSCLTPRQETVERSHTCTWTTKPKAEAMGSCEAGDSKGAACKADADCPGSTCKGYQAEVTGVSGYGACGCKEIELDVQRWVTTYRREGRWITDISHALHYLAKGGTVRFHYKPSYPYIATLKLRLRTTGKGRGAAAEVVPLFEGGNFNASYNDTYKPLEVQIPKDAKRVELLLDVSGHGFGKDTANCAEFCNHTHHFTLEGSAGSKEWVRTQPYVGDNFGCAKQVPLGTVPNQFGTWTLGRGGWCPGQEIPLTIWDVSSHAKPGATVKVSYQGKLGGQPYIPVPYDSPGGGFGARIDMKSWLLIYK